MLEQYDVNNRADGSLPSFFMKEPLLEFCRASVWLQDTLAAREVSEAEISRHAFAYEQRYFFGGNCPWKLAEKVLEEVAEGTAPEPGVELADKLLADMLLDVMFSENAK